MFRFALARVVFTLLVGCLVANLAHAQPTGYEGYQVVRIEIEDKADLQILNELLSYHPDFELWTEVAGIGSMDVRVAPKARPILEGSNLCYEVVIPDLQKHINNLYRSERDGDYWDHLRTYEDYVQLMQSLAAAYPELTEMFSIGQSVEGREMWVLRITGPGGGDKPAVMYHGAQHGNEQAAASVVGYAAEYILTHYASDPEVAKIVDEVELFLMPVMNPDGYSSFARVNANGIDLNRNWGGPGSGQDSSGGPYPFSEPETAAMRDFFLAHANIRVHIDFHGYVAMLLYPWGHTSELCPDQWTYQIFGRRNRALIRDAGGGLYDVGPVNPTLYPVYGGSNDYTYGELGIWAFTFELRDAELPGVCHYFLPTTLYMAQLISDCNENGIPDADDIDLGNSFDCSGNGIPDECEKDCNENGTADNCDCLDGTSADCTGNLIPDECEDDCNDNGEADSCDIADGTSEDCNNNGVPDECMHLEDDCNENGVPDGCDITGGFSEDCNYNGVPDECMDLEEDCNQNDAPDVCDILDGLETDCQGNLIPDSCDIAGGDSQDCNLDGIPDECQVYYGITGVNMEKTRLLTNINHEQITALIPDRFDFSEGETGDEIVDGGENMYDGGNRLTTSRATRIPYTNGAVLSADDDFGPNSRYFTEKYPGLFLAVVWDLHVDWFGIRGNLGADGAGSVDTALLQTVYPDPQILFTIFVKRVYDAGTPSVNHIMIVPGNGSEITQLINEDTDSDRDRLSSMGGTPLLIYALVSRQNGGYLEDETILEIANQLLNNLVFAWADCNGNGIPDDCDIAEGSVRDANANGIIDTCECWGDLTGDNEIDLADLNVLLSNYDQTEDIDVEDGDLDADGDVDITDLAELLGSYGTSCG